MITFEKGKFVLRSRTTGKVLGIFSTRAEAEAQMRAIEEAQAPAAEHGGHRDEGLVERTQRIDAGDLAPPQVTAEGFLKLDAVLARTGVQKYPQADGSVRLELRTDDEVKKSAPLMALIPLTDGHPREGLLDPTNVDGYAAGAVGAATYADGLVRAPVTVWSAGLIDAIRAGVRELSVGYSCRVVQEDGVHEGQRYTHRQVDIQPNHLAVVSRGRCGPQCRVRADCDEPCDGHCGHQNQEETMTDDEKQADTSAANPIEAENQALRERRDALVVKARQDERDRAARAENEKLRKQIAALEKRGGGVSAIDRAREVVHADAFDSANVFFTRSDMADRQLRRDEAKREMHRAEQEQINEYWGTTPPWHDDVERLSPRQKMHRWDEHEIAKIWGPERSTLIPKGWSGK